MEFVYVRLGFLLLWDQDPFLEERSYFQGIHGKQIETDE